MSESGQARLGATAPVASRTRVKGGVVRHAGGNDSPVGPLRARTTLDIAVDHVFQNASELLHKKHEAYGPTNISRSPGGPLNGLRVRMWDKMARINHIIDNPSVDVNDESLRDSFVDLMNYAAIAQIVLDGDWPEA